jgi:hypothetical protein
MSNYLVCYKKRNNPRIDIRICLHKCHLKGECREFQNYQKEAVRREAQPYSPAEPNHLATA